MTRRSWLVTAGWLGAVVLAVLVGLAAINVIGAGLTSADGTPRSEADVERALARSTPLPAPPSTAPASPSVSPTPSRSVSPPSGPAAARPVSQSYPTRGGIVVVTCTDAGPDLQMSPAPGFAVHEKTETEGEFRSSNDNHDRVKFSVACRAGKPVFTPRGGGGDG